MAEMQIVAEDVAAPTLDMDVNLEVDDKRAAFIKAVNAEFVLAVGKYGGPRQYLLAQLPDHSSQNAFAHWLWTEFPERDDIFYNHNQTFETLASEAEMAKVRH